jgi:hypothetical protein
MKVIIDRSGICFSLKRRVCQEKYFDEKKVKRNNSSKTIVKKR